MKNKVVKYSETPSLQKGSLVEWGEKENHESSGAWGRKRSRGNGGFFSPRPHSAHALFHPAPLGILFAGVRVPVAPPTHLKVHGELLGAGN